MYPSFRGANGNPGYFETFFGDIDDILAAAEFAAALPYTDADRIYLGGHSTGGTRVLLASALTDRFRAVFSFGPVSDINNHNRSQFTFDVNNRQERMLRSPMYWLDDIQSPTFIFGGDNALAKNSNENLQVFQIEGDDHFNILAPITLLMAQKIQEDIGAVPNISVSEYELQQAMTQTPVTPVPFMRRHHNERYGFHLLLPALWEERLASDETSFIFAARFSEDNPWESSYMIVEMFEVDEHIPRREIEDIWGLSGFSFRETDIGGNTAYVWEGIADFGDSGQYFSGTVTIQTEDSLAAFNFYAPNEFRNSAGAMFREIMYSIQLK
jgi:hypothetical protein